MNLLIHPETKVGALLEAYPALEPVLISMAPAFEKLRNPILRKTVAKVATVQQAARIGGLPVRDLVRELRRSVGQPLPDSEQPDEREGEPDAEPAWVSESRVRSDLDGDVLLKQGLHPLGKLRECVAALSPQEVVRLSTSFRPEPLIELLRQAGVDAYSRQDSPGRYLTYFHPRPA